MNHNMLLIAEYDVEGQKEQKDQMFKCDTCTECLFKHTNPFWIEVVEQGDINVCHQIGSGGLLMDFTAGTEPIEDEPTPICSDTICKTCKPINI